MLLLVLLQTTRRGPGPPLRGADPPSSPAFSADRSAHRCTHSSLLRASGSVSDPPSQRRLPWPSHPADMVSLGDFSSDDLPANLDIPPQPFFLLSPLLEGKGSKSWDFVYVVH